MAINRKEYLSDMKDEEWKLIKEILEKELTYTKEPRVKLEEY